MIRGAVAISPLLAGGFLLAATAAAADVRLELRGRIQPPPGEFAAVTLHGSDFPFNAQTHSDTSGRFRFRKLEPGQYVVIVALPARGEVRRTIVVTPGVADRRGRIEVTVPFEPSGEALQNSATIDYRRLTIADRARSEFDKARSRLGKRDVDGAIRHLEKAVAISPHFVEAWNSLGTIAYQTGRYADAERYFRTALGYDPNDYSPLVNLGGALLSLQRPRDALPYNEQAVALRPDEALAHSQLGLNWFLLGDDEKARRHLEEARRIDPSHFSHPQITLARIHISRGAWAEARRELEDFLKRHPDATNARAARQWIERFPKVGSGGPAR